MKITIEKAKLIKGETLSVSYMKISDDGKKSTVKDEEFEGLVHNDLVESFNGLAIHLAVLTYYVKAKSVKDIENPAPELTEGFVVRAISYGGDDDDQGITISGHNKGEGKPVILNSPFRRFEENDATAYKFMNNLVERLDKICDDVRAHMDGTKRGVDPQLGLDFPEQKEEKKEKSTKLQILPFEKTQPTLGENFTNRSKAIPPADPEAMKRVKEGDIEDAKVISEIKKKPAGRPKKVAQSADNPSGIINE